MLGLYSDPSGDLCSPQSSLQGGLPASPSPSQLATRLNSQYLASFMFPRQEGEHTEGQHVFLTSFTVMETEGEGGQGGFPRCFS